jgi:ubiquitin-conjugating enzyme E2 A
MSSSSESSAQQVRVATLRLASDLRSIQADAPAGCSASPANDDNLFSWNATIVGPDESPWEGGIFTLRLQFPDQYPDKAPRVKFTTEMFHPNIFPDGTLCLDIIQDKWKPIYTVSTILASIQSLLCDPNNDSPANVDAARLLASDPKEYKRRVRRLAAKSLEQ